MAKKIVKKASEPKKAVKKSTAKAQSGEPRIVAKKASKVAGKADPSKSTAASASKKRAQGKALPHNMTANEPTVGKGHNVEGVPAIEKRVKTKIAVVGKAQRITVPVRTGVGGGRPGGGATGELSPTSDTAAGRGHGQKRKKR